jgi:hypothetical protein
MITSIKRLYEADDVQELPMNGQMPHPAQAQQMAPPAPVATSAEMMPDFSFQEEPESEPAQEQPALPQPDVMNLTVQELIDRCDKINPLICMGLQQFIELNKDEILSQTTGEAPAEGGEEETVDGEPDINFSKQMEPQAPQFSLDQPENDLQFPQG